MMKPLQWFGPNDYKARRGDLGRVDIPVEAACVVCGEPFASDSAGVVVPHFGDMTMTQEPHHMLCFMRVLGIGPKDGR